METFGRQSRKVRRPRQNLANGREHPGELLPSCRSCPRLILGNEPVGFVSLPRTGDVALHFTERRSLVPETVLFSGAA